MSVSLATWSSFSWGILASVSGPVVTLIASIWVFSGVLLPVGHAQSTSRRYPQLVLFRWNSRSTPRSFWMSEGDPSHHAKESHFSHLYPWSHSFSDLGCWMVSGVSPPDLYSKTHHFTTLLWLGKARTLLKPGLRGQLCMPMGIRLQNLAKQL